MGEQLKCPVCRRRLFDLRSEQAELIMKCPICRNLLHVLGKRVEIITFKTK